MPDSKQPRQCEKEGCDKKHLARGLCRRHYDQLPEPKAVRLLADRRNPNRRLWQRNYHERKKDKLPIPHESDE